MINSFREWILDVVGAYEPGYVKGKLSKGKKITQKTLSKLKKESKAEKIQKNEISKKQLPDRESDDEYEIDNIMMKLDQEIPAPKKYRIHKVISEEQKLIQHFRFINYSEESFDLLRNSLKNNLQLPDKFERFKAYLNLKNGRLYFKDLPILRQSEIQKICRETYFNPEEPIGCDQIYKLIQHKAANLSRTKVRKAIQSIEQYQLRREIRRPKEVMSNFKVFSTNTAMVDMFFINNFKFVNIAEAFSGYIKVYYVNSGNADLINECMIDFIKIIKGYNHKISRILSDPGSENKKLKNIPGIVSIFTETAQPLHLIEYYNSLVAKRLMLYLDLKFDPSEVLPLIMNGINNRVRRRRNDFSPIEILNMSVQDQKRIAQDIVYKVPEQFYNMKKIRKGSYVRILMVSRKSQRVRSMSYKGYRKKYSAEVYQVSRIKRIPGTLNVFKYVVNSKEYFRNELLLVPEYIDKIIPQIQKLPRKDPLFALDDDDGIYVPSDIDSDYDD